MWTKYAALQGKSKLNLAIGTVSAICLEIPLICPGGFLEFLETWEATNDWTSPC
jgi:hypothetical protein